MSHFTDRAATAAEEIRAGAATTIEGGDDLTSRYTPAELGTAVKALEILDRFAQHASALIN